jgi:hypothetical protein
MGAGVLRYKFVNVHVPFKRFLCIKPMELFVTNGALSRRGRSLSSIRRIFNNVMCFDVILARLFLLELGWAVGTGELGLRGVDVQMTFESFLGPLSFELPVTNWA